jgi:ribonuclease VapC
MSSRYVFDSQALIAYLCNEPGADQVDAILNDRRQERWLSAINLGEIYYVAARRTDMREDEVLSDILSMPLTIVDASTLFALEAARIKAKQRLSYADCFAVALAQRFRASVVTGDPEFEPLEQSGRLSVVWLPRRPKHRA